MCLWLDCFLSDLEVQVEGDGEYGPSLEESVHQRRHSGVKLH